MVRTRQGAMTDSSLVRGSDQSFRNENDPDWNPLVEIWVKGMREMSCITYRGEEDAELAGHWLRKVERVINQIQVLEELRVDCVTQLLVDSAHSWWETIKERRLEEVLRWRDFHEEFK